METTAYFLRYLLPTVLSFVTVIALAVFNHFIGPMVWAGRLAERIEILSYSILTAGPITFAISFVIFFYGIELLKEPWPFAKALFTIACVMALIGIIANIIFLPKMR